MQATLSDQTHLLVEKTSIGDVCQEINSGQKAFFAGRHFNAGEVISSFAAGEIHHTPSYLTLQIDDHKHIMLSPTYLQYINHSCNPNSFFDTTNLNLVALRDIAINEEFSFFYPSTEWDMDQPFVCNCRHQDCLGVIRGAKHLNDQQIQGYRVNQYVLRKRREQQ